jgi:hypothetical protein
LHWDHDREREFIVSVLQGSFIPELRVASATHHRVEAEEVEELMHKHEDVKRKVYQRLMIPLKKGERLFRYPPHLRCKRPTQLNLEARLGSAGGEKGDDDSDCEGDEGDDGRENGGGGGPKGAASKNSGGIAAEVEKQEAENARFQVDRASAPDLGLEQVLLIDCTVPTVPSLLYCPCCTVPTVLSLL